MSRPPEKPLSMAGLKGYASLGPGAAKRERHRALAAGEIGRRAIERITIAARTGVAVRIVKGQILRIACSQGPQVADFIAFNADDPSERFWAARTRVIHGGHLGVGHQLWSTPPRTRPMMTIIADTVAHEALPQGAASHDLLFCRCDGRHYEIVHGVAGAANCQDNLAGAIAGHGLGPHDVHDPLNIFMTTGLNEEGRPFYLPADAKAGDYVELVAEIDCLAAISACPGGSSGPASFGLEVTVFAPE